MSIQFLNRFYHEHRSPITKHYNWVYTLFGCRWWMHNAVLISAITCSGSGAQNGTGGRLSFFIFIDYKRDIHRASRSARIHISLGNSALWYFWWWKNFMVSDYSLSTCKQENHPNWLCDVARHIYNISFMQSCTFYFILRVYCYD